MRQCEIIPYDHDSSIVPDAILTGDAPIVGEYAPLAERLHRMQQAQAWENLPYNMARALEPFVVAVKSFAENLSAAFADPDSEMSRLLRYLGRATPHTAVSSQRRYERRKARAGDTPRRKRDQRRKRRPHLTSTRGR